MEQRPDAKGPAHPRHVTRLRVPRTHVRRASAQLVLWLAGMALLALLPARVLAQDAPALGLDIAAVPAWSDNTSRNSLASAWGDLDGDGDLDFVVGTLEQNIRVFVNRGGTLELAQQLESTLRAADLALGDLNRDGRLDLVVANGSSFCNQAVDDCAQPDQLYLNQTTTPDRIDLTPLSFSDDPTGGDWTESSAVALVDLNGDAWLDIVFAGMDGLRIYRSRGADLAAMDQLDAGGFCADSVYPSGITGFSVDQLAAADYDLDGDPDLAVNLTVPDGTGNWPRYVMLFKNMQGERDDTCFDLDAWFPVNANVNGLAWGDMDGDTAPDLAVSAYAAPIQIWTNVDMAGTFAPDCAAAVNGWTAPTADETNDIAWGDVDNDGDLDLAVSNRGESVNKIYVNEGGTLGTAPAWEDTVTHESTEIQWGDIDNDGDVDLAVAVYAAPDFVYANAGTLLSRTPATVGAIVATQEDDADPALRRWSLPRAWRGAMWTATTTTSGPGRRLHRLHALFRPQPTGRMSGVSIFEPCWGPARNAVFLNEGGSAQAAAELGIRRGRAHRGRRLG
ncbi:MAG: VCBS repeat-containing protein [Caldilineaceae bacterium]